MFASGFCHYLFFLKSHFFIHNYAQSQNTNITTIKKLYVGFYKQIWKTHEAWIVFIVTSHCTYKKDYNNLELKIYGKTKLEKTNWSHPPSLSIIKQLKLFEIVYCYQEKLHCNWLNL